MAKYQDGVTAVDAVQFDPHKQPWPEGVKPWSEAGYQPRDMSWGYIQTPTAKIHVMNGDWIITDALGAKSTCKEDVFFKTYTPVQDGTIWIPPANYVFVKFTYEGKHYEGKAHLVKHEVLHD